MSRLQDTSIIPTPNAQDEVGNKLDGFYTINTKLNTRLSFLYNETDDTCCIAVTDLNEGQGMHVYVTTDTLDALVTQFANLIDDKED